MQHLKFIRLHEVEDHLRLGWMPGHIDGGLANDHHGDWSIIGVWPCDCKLREPLREGVHDRRNARQRGRQV
jgi:hypothetical protein